MIDTDTTEVPRSLYGILHTLRGKNAIIHTTGGIKLIGTIVDFDTTHELGIVYLEASKGPVGIVTRHIVTVEPHKKPAAPVFGPNR